MYLQLKLLICILLLGIHSYGQIDRLPDTLSHQIDLAMAEELLHQELFGMSIGIVQNGKIVYTKGYGHMDEDRSVPVTTSTVFNWASISKTLTAVAAFQLIEDGKLTKSSKAKTILKGIWTNADDKNKITVGHLLSHRSGIRHYDSDKGDDIEADFDLYTDRDIRSDWNAEQSVAIFNDLKLMSTPSDSFRYSTFGYNLLGAMIDKVSESGYVGHITKRILGPLDTKSIDIARKPWEAFHKDCNGAVHAWEEGEKRHVLPGGGWKSNILDLTIFMNALINNSLLNKTSSLWSDVTKGGKIIDNNGYRFGLKVRNDDINQEFIVFHAGKHENVRTLMSFFPDSKLGFCIFLNGGYGSDNRIFHVLATLFGKPQNEYRGPFMTWESHDNCSDNITGVWTGGEEHSLIRFGYNQGRFDQEIGYLKSKDYGLVDCEYFLDDDEILAIGSFQKNVITKYIPPCDFPTFQLRLAEMERTDYFLDDVEAFQLNEHVLWSGVLVRKVENQY